MSWLFWTVVIYLSMLAVLRLIQCLYPRVMLDFERKLVEEQTPLAYCLTMLWSLIVMTSAIYFLLVGRP